MSTPAVASFPTAVWDGDTTTRAPGDDKAPDYVDWNQIVAEVIACQNELDAGLDGSNVKVAAAANVVAGIPLVYVFDIVNTAADYDIVVTHKFLVTDVVVVKTNGAGGAGDTLTVKNGSTAITNAIVTNIADKTIARAGTIDDASHAVAAAGTLRCTAAKNTDCSCRVYIHGLKIA